MYKRQEKTGVVPFMLDDTSRNEKTKMSMVFYINQSKYILSFELDAKHIYSETLIVYDSIRPTKLYNRSYDCLLYTSCGPPMMISAVTKMLYDLGVPDENVMYDNFGG